LCAKNKAKVILCLIALLHAAVHAEQENEKVIQADDQTIGKIFGADLQKIRVVVPNYNHFAIDIFLLDGVLEKKRRF